LGAGPHPPGQVAYSQHATHYAHGRVTEQKKLRLRMMLEQKSDAEKERGWRGAEDERG